MASRPWKYTRAYTDVNSEVSNDVPEFNMRSHRRCVLGRLHAMQVLLHGYYKWEGMGEVF